LRSSEARRTAGSDLPVGANAERIVNDEGDVNTITYVGTQAQTDPCIIALRRTSMPAIRRDVH
jgi:hypothetical protein